MPLVVLTAEDAMAHTRGPASRWPRSAEQQAGRLSPLAQPQVTPSFRLDKNDLIFTIGSCFARNIEKQLAIEGFNVAATKFEPPADLGVRGDPGALLNRYVVHAIGNELRWGLGHGKPFRPKYYLRFGEQWYDPHMHPAILPGSLEAVQARRDAIGRYMRRAAEASVFVITLGLAEAWFDVHTGIYLNGVVPNLIRKRQPERFQFHILDYEQVLAQLRAIHRLIKAYGRADAKTIITVSPVALNTTFGGGDALVANSYSKAVQRAAVEAFVTSHADVDYFPSYESVMLSDRARVWREDQAHPSDEIVRLNVLRMIEAYTAGPAQAANAAKGRHELAIEAFGLTKHAKTAAAAGDADGARTQFLAARNLAPGEALIALAFGEFLLDVADFDAARVQFKAAARLGGGRYGAYYQLAKAFRGLHRFGDALGACRSALTFEPTRPGLLFLCADLLGRLKRYEEAVEFAERCAALEPEDERFRDLLRRLRAKLEAPKPIVPETLRTLRQRLSPARARRAPSKPAG